MKKLSTILLLTFLFSCSTNNTSSNVNQDENSYTSSLDSISSSTNSIELDKKNIEEFEEYLLDINGHPNKVNAVMNNYYNFSAGEDADLEGKDTFEVNRYKRENASDIVIRKGSQIVGNSITNYESQIFADSDYFYNLINDGTNKRKTTIIYLKSQEETNFNISFGLTQISNLDYLKSLIGDERVTYTLNLPTSYLLKGEVSFSYSLTALDSNSAKTQQISHEITLNIENSVITKAKHITQTDMYAGGVKANWQRIESSYTYTQGEYEKYDGEVFNPKEYIEE